MGNETRRASPARLAEIAMALSEESSVGSLCESILRFALELNGCRRGLVLLARPGRRMEIAAATPGDLRPTTDGADAAAVAPGMPTSLASPGSGILKLPLTTGSPHSGPQHTGLQLLGELWLYEVDSSAEAAVCEQLDVLVKHASVALASLQELAHLRIALSTRTVIGQAQGILMERYGIDGDRAFAVLRRYSQDRNMRLTDVAHDVVATRRLPEDH